MKGKRAADDVSVSDLHQSDAELLDRNEKKTKVRRRILLFCSLFNALS